MVQAQGPTSHWYFGNGAGLRFTTYQPTILLNSAMPYSPEGCAAISDANGDLLLYGNPSLALNRIHDTIENGSGLQGDPSSTQGAIIIPNPIDSTLFYCVTHNGSQHFYSVIRFTEDYPYGQVLEEEKNLLLAIGTTEKATAVHHANGKDVWLLLRKASSDSLLAFLINEYGIGPTPVVSQITNDGIFGYAGQLKSSPNGKFISECYSVGVFQYPKQGRLHRFNDTTGQVYQSITILDSSAVYYGTEFSSNSEFVYFSNSLFNQGVGIYQYSLGGFDSAAVLASKFPISSSTHRALQIGVDKKVYGVKTLSGYLSRIENPDVYGPSVVYTDSALSVAPNSTALGLPDFIQSYFRPAYFEYTSKCDEPVRFESFCGTCDSLLWDFGDSTSGLNSSILQHPQHDYSSDGFYVVRLIVYDGNEADTFYREIFVKKSLNTVGLNMGIVLCDSLVKLGASFQPMLAKYEWSTAATSDTIEVTTTGTYYCTIIGFCDTVVDTFRVEKDAFPIILELKDTAVCEGIAIEIQPTVTPPSSAYLWFTGDTASTITIDTVLAPGVDFLDVWLSATNACGTASDTMTVEFLPVPVARLPADSVHCNAEPFFVFHDGDYGMEYGWNDGTTEDRLLIDTSMTVWLVVENVCGVSTDTFSVEFYSAIGVDLGDDTIVCAGDSIEMNAAWQGASYLWNTGSTSSSVVVSSADKYVVTVSVPPCQKVFSRTLSVAPDACDSSECKFSIPNVFTPNGDGINDVLWVSNVCDAQDFTVFIYNRWGQLVHRSSNHLAGASWDGYVSGEPAIAGTYFVVAQFNSGKTQRNAVALMR